MKEKKKVLLFAYAHANLGDNLFIYMILKRYPNVDFYIHLVEEGYDRIYKDFKNIHYLHDGRNVDKIDIEEYDAYVYVGGSIFMESEYSMHEVKEFNKFIKKCNEKNKKFYYMSCNFGPYKTKEYLELVRENFSLCSGVCFREKKSYDMFKDIDKVMYAPDMIFSLKINQKVEKEKRSIGISVINIQTKEDLKTLEAIYNDFIKRIIIKFAKRKYKVYLFSFSEFERDGEEIDNIINLVPEEYKASVEKVVFREDIENYLEKYGQMEYMVCGRFHSMLLSMLFNQKIYVLSYSKKIDNVIEEWKLLPRYQKIKDMTYETVLRKYYFRKVGKSKLDKISKEAENQFLNLDKYIAQND